MKGDQCSELKPVRTLQLPDLIKNLYVDQVYRVLTLNGRFNTRSNGYYDKLLDIALSENDGGQDHFQTGQLVKLPSNWRSKAPKKGVKSVALGLISCHDAMTPFVFHCPSGDIRHIKEESPFHQIELTPNLITSEEDTIRRQVINNYKAQ